jgi:hypothetical protein
VGVVRTLDEEDGLFYVFSDGLGWRCDLVCASWRRRIMPKADRDGRMPGHIGMCFFFGFRYRCGDMNAEAS